MLNNITDKIRLLFRKDKELYLSLYDIIGCYPHDISYYKLALMHKSVAQRSEKGKPINNERLEFLGDAILDAIVGAIVYHHFPGKREGFLTNTRSKIVQRDMLNKLAKEMGITRLIHSDGRSCSHNSYMGGNAFEALVGALYLDRGYNACMKFMEKRILGELINIDKVAYKEMNFKSKLIEWAQKNRIDICFDMLDEKTDEDGSPMFHFQILLEGIASGEGKGYSKKESQQIAAKTAFYKIRKEKGFSNKLFEARDNRLRMEEEAAYKAVVADESCQNDGDTEHKADFKTLILEDSKRATEQRESGAVARFANITDSIEMDGSEHRKREAVRESIIAEAEAKAFGAEL